MYHQGMTIHASMEKMLEMRCVALKGPLWCSFALEMRRVATYTLK
jgi:hypothetical protein